MAQHRLHFDLGSSPDRFLAGHRGQLASPLTQQQPHPSQGSEPERTFRPRLSDSPTLQLRPSQSSSHEIEDVYHHSGLQPSGVCNRESFWMESTITSQPT